MGSLILAMSVSSVCRAADTPKSQTKSNSEKRTTVNFEDQLVEGQTQKPELFYILQQRDAKFKRLIKLRENFLPEMRETAEDISRNGSAK
jgi:thioredoxin-like negative regulator of GroEL